MLNYENEKNTYTKEDVERHQRTEWSVTAEAQAERLARCQDTLELVPGWAPGRSMKPPQPAVMKLAPGT